VCRISPERCRKRCAKIAPRQPDIAQCPVVRGCKKLEVPPVAQRSSQSRGALTPVPTDPSNRSGNERAGGLHGGLRAKSTKTMRAAY
jgi:hypothetical protein